MVHLSISRSEAPDTTLGVAEKVKGEPCMLAFRPNTNIFARTPFKRRNVLAGKFEIYKDKKGELRFRLKASNGGAILASEGYKSRVSCRNGIASVQKNGPNPDRYQGKIAKNGEHHFALKAANHQVIGTSQLYDSERGMTAGMKSVQKNASTTKVEDLATA